MNDYSLKESRLRQNTIYFDLFIQSNLALRVKIQAPTDIDLAEEGVQRTRCGEQGSM